jgi:hypothetical protein
VGGANGPRVLGRGEEDGIVALFDLETGAVQRAFGFGGLGAKASVNHVQPVGRQHVVVCGSFSGTMTFDSIVFPDSEPGTERAAYAFLASTKGRVEWVGALVSDRDNDFLQSSAFADQSIALTGSVAGRSASYFSKAAGAAHAASTPIPGVGTDIFLLRLNPDGRL